MHHLMHYNKCSEPTSQENVTSQTFSPDRDHNENLQQYNNVSNGFLQPTIMNVKYFIITIFFFSNLNLMIIIMV